ncbi:hypothetical protein DC31_06200 [Microbacterium sp. CH12i]|uniref:hypothetical protein n=1 Tax=Microbacterium sp. CH12i TaxID=1479651 RepID=UPI000461814E|nr:hypothetical protein [Microbacterium sp. CH12i]KDA04587.1 hypothetical protein DC31_06200 [Microbacterium sp. CH12i]
MMYIKRIEPEDQLIGDERASGAWKGLILIGLWVAFLVWATAHVGIWADTLVDPSWLIAGAWVFFAIACIATLGMAGIGVLIAIPWVQFRARESRK